MLYVSGLFTDSCVAVLKFPCAVIEVEAGKEFKICYEDLPLDAGHQSDVDVFIDGSYVTDIAICKRKKDNSDVKTGEFRGYWEVNAKSESVLRSFVFGKIQTTGR